MTISVDYLITPVIISSMISTLFCFYILSPVLSKKFFQQYNSFTEDKKIFWNTLPGSTITSIVLSFVVSMALVFDSVLQQTTMGFLASNIHTGFLIADSIILMSHSSLRSDQSIIFHHIVGLLGTYFWVRITKDRWITLYFYRLLSLEASTPFVNLRWLISETISPSNPLFVLANIVMTVAFFLSRIFTIPFLWYLFFDILADPFLESYSPNYAKVFGASISFLLDCLNILWAWRIINGWFDAIKEGKLKNH